jgi:N-acyl-D-amino-acid deacylase
MKSIITLLIGFIGCTGYAQNFDILIKNGKIVDGAGNSWYYGDVGIWNGKIYVIGQLPNAKAAKVIDAKGLIVAPGFIDVHAHIEGDEWDVPTADNFIHDGVTSVVTGNCGGSNVDMKSYFHRLEEP